MSGRRLRPEDLEVVDAAIGAFRRHERDPSWPADLIRFDEVPGPALVELIDRLGDGSFSALEESPEADEVRSIVRTCRQPVFDVQVVHRADGSERARPPDDRVQVKAVGVQPEDLDQVEALLGPDRVAAYVWTWEELR